MICKKRLCFFQENYFGIYTYVLCLSFALILKTFIFHIFGNCHHQLNFAVIFWLTKANIKIFCQCQFLLIHLAACWLGWFLWTEMLIPKMIMSEVAISKIFMSKIRELSLIWLLLVLHLNFVSSFRFKFKYIYLIVSTRSSFIFLCFLNGCVIIILTDRNHFFCISQLN